MSEGDGVVAYASRRALFMIGSAVIGAATWSGIGTSRAYADDRAVAFAGCEDVFVGPRCLVRPDSSIRFWVPTEDATTVRVALDGERVHPRMTPLLDGVTFEVTPSQDISIIAVEGSLSAARFEVSLFHHGPDEALDMLRAADRRRREAGGLDDAEHMVDAALGSANPLARARAMGLAARIAMKRGRFDDAVTLFEHSREAHRSLGCTSGQLRDLTALAFLWTYLRRDFVAAGYALRQARDVASANDEVLATVAFYEGQLDFVTGDFLGALHHFEQAVRDAERLSLAAAVGDARMSRVDVLTRIGRCEEALNLLEDLAGKVESTDTNHRAENEANQGWLRLLCSPNVEADSEQYAQIIGHLDRGIELLRAVGHAAYESGALGSLAHARLRVGDVEGARAALQAAEKVAPNADPRLRADRLGLAAQILADSGQVDASLEALARLREYADRHQLPFKSWQARSATAVVLAGAGRNEVALRAFAEAERELLTLFALVPLGVGRDAFAASHEDLARRHLQLLLQMDLPAEAFRVAVDSRARTFRLLEVARRLRRLDPQRSQGWASAVEQLVEARARLEPLAREEAALRDERRMLPLDELADFDQRLRAVSHRAQRARRQMLEALNSALGALGREDDLEPSPEPGPGELVLAFHPLPVGWAGIARSAEAVRSVRFDDHQVTADGLMGAFAPELRAAKRVGIVAMGPLERMDLHAVEVDGAPIGLTKPVRYLLPLGPAPRSPAWAREALVISVDQPRAPLPLALEEGRRVAASLRARGWKVVHLEGPLATREAVLNHLRSPSISLLHYAGHATTRSTTPDGWESRFLLADGPLHAAEILALERVPERVVLSACSGARSSGQRHGGLGLGQTFLLSGARWVLATVRDIDDAVAAQVLERLYATTDPMSDDGELFSKFRETERWSDYRIIERW